LKWIGLMYCKHLRTINLLRLPLSNVVLSEIVEKALQFCPLLSQLRTIFIGSAKLISNSRAINLLRLSFSNVVLSDFARTLRVL
jgi:hypothetical protein